MPSPLPEPRKKRIFENVRDAILDHIQAGRLNPGDRLPSERALAEKFEVGRHAVREALRTLEISGVLEFKKGMAGGAFVRERSGEGVSQSIKDMIVLGRMPLEDLMVVRINLLVQAVELAADRASEQDFAAIADNIADMRAAIAAGDPVATIAPIMGFNRLLGAASHNLVLAMLVDSVADIMEDILRVYRLPTDVDLVTPRMAILDALRARDGMRAATLIRTHFVEMTDYVLGRVGSKSVPPAGF